MRIGRQARGTSRKLLRTGASLLLAGALAHADVLEVDPGGGPGTYSAIQDAVDAAASGDTVLVVGGAFSDYGPFGVVIDGKGLSLVVDGGLTAGLRYEFGPGLTVRNLPPGEPVLVRGLAVTLAATPLGPPEGEGLLVEDCQAAVWLEDCFFQGAYGRSGLPAHEQGWAGVRVIDSEAVSLVRCAVSGGIGFSDLFLGGVGAPGGSGLVSDGCDVQLYESEVTGGAGGAGWNGIFMPGPWQGGPGGAGVELGPGSLFASDAGVSGGVGGTGSFNSGSGQCERGGSGGTGLVVSAGASAVILDSSLEGGAGGEGGSGGPPGCAPDGPAGGATDVAAGGSLSGLAGAARHGSQSAVGREGGLVTVSIAGQPGDSLMWTLSLSHDALWLPARKGVLLPDAGALLLLPLGLLPGSGSLELFLPVPELGPGIEGLVLHGQAAHLGAGDGWVLGSPSATLLLDASF